MYSPNFQYAEPFNHVQRGSFNGPPQQWLTIALQWPGITNVGNLTGHVGLRASLEEHRTGLPNVDWAIYSPITNESGPRFIVDKVFTDTNGAHQISGGSIKAAVAPGASVIMGVSIQVPGVSQGQAMVNFWNNEGNVEFNLHLWLFEVTVNDVLVPHTDDRQSIAHHFFNSAFQLV